MKYYQFTTKTGDQFDVDKRLWSSPYRASDEALWAVNNTLHRDDKPYEYGDFEQTFDWDARTLHLNMPTSEIFITVLELEVAQDDD